MQLLENGFTIIIIMEDFCLTKVKYLVLSKFFQSRRPTYQICAHLSFGKYIGSPSFTSNAL